MMYKKLFGMMTLSFFIMYGVMFLNVDEPEHIYLSLTRLYMTLLMIAPMAIVMLAFMWHMYPDKSFNKTIMRLSTVVFILALICLRTQAFISDRQYMKAMIPHHSSAVMTSRHADITDPAVRALADSIIVSQRNEIRQMKTMLERLN